MMDLLFAGVGWTDLALTLNRIALGAFFMLSGYHKLFNAERHRTFTDELKGLGVPALGFNQWWVPLVEFTAGGGVLIGLLAPLAALGLLVIILVSIATSGRQRIKLYKPIDEADRIDRRRAVQPRRLDPGCDEQAYCVTARTRRGRHDERDQR
jgi:uncharacterized membrane protein YphA (DoxX/SURF4 family)